MRNYTHITTRYIFDRLNNMFFEFKNPALPWLTRDSIKILSTWLKSGDVGLEFGSGRSTLWIANRVSHLTSVEHDLTWYQIISEKLKIKKNVKYLLKQDGITHSSSSEYVSVINAFIDNSLDFCLVDGMARDHCSMLSIPKIKPGGILIIDNINWYHPTPVFSVSPNSMRDSDSFKSDGWSEVAKMLRDWRCIWTSNGVTDTAIFVKPC